MPKRLGDLPYKMREASSAELLQGGDVRQGLLKRFPGNPFHGEVGPAIMGSPAKRAHYSRVANPSQQLKLTMESTPHFAVVDAPVQNLQCDVLIG
ncbi:MAG: hypothetical protein QGI83_05565 [Candidatus Latescibacteria bacterium]|nr:hypothetical protein [Candidatus Latescibacterota bacterium]